MASKKSSTMSFRWNYGRGVIAERLGFGKDLNKKFAETLLKYGEQYTPKKTGLLREKATVTANDRGGYITYPGVPYAQMQYNANDAGWKRHTPGTYSEWFEYAWTIHKFQISGEVGAYRRWHSK